MSTIPRDLRLERDMRVFMGALGTRIGDERARLLAQAVNNRAAKMPGNPNSVEWFRAWQEVLAEQGTEHDAESALWALGLVKKLWDAGF